jgi:hypothetical protein
MKYPTAISRTLDIRIMEVDADPDRHGNQQRTVHGMPMLHNSP